MLKKQLDSDSRWLRKKRLKNQTWSVNGSVLQTGLDRVCTVEVRFMLLALRVRFVVLADQVSLFKIEVDRVGSLAWIGSTVQI